MEKDLLEKLEAELDRNPTLSMSHYAKNLGISVRLVSEGIRTLQKKIGDNKNLKFWLGTRSLREVNYIRYLNTLIFIKEISTLYKNDGSQDDFNIFYSWAIKKAEQVPNEQIYYMIRT